MSREIQAQRIGKMIRDGLGEPKDAARGNSAEAVFAAMNTAAEPRRSLRRYGAMAALWLVLTVGAAISLDLLLRPQSMAYRIGEGAQTDTSFWVHNADRPMLPIVFENGSRFVLDRNAVVKVMETDDERVRIDLNRGRLSARVNGNGHTQWQVEAGPYTVRVLGTVFAVDWDADAERLEVSVTSGHVSVSGADVGKGVVLDAGRHLVSHGSGVHINKIAAIDASATVPRVAKQSEGVPPAATQSGAAPVDSAPSAHRAESVKYESAAPTPAAEIDAPFPLEARIAERNWPAAVDLLDAAGAEKTARSVDLDVLWHLADAARRAGRPTLSEQLFTAVRERFPNTERAATAAFLLGKSALDAERDFSAAKRWFNVYLSEAPGGTLSEEAMGRLIEVYSALGRQSDAVKTAHQYLDRYPQGSFAESARRLTAAPAADTAAP